MCGGEGDACLKLATAVEFIHTATLLHDDVVDGSKLRRGKVAAHLIWGGATSVLVGDFLFARAFELMVETGSLRVLDILSKAAREGGTITLIHRADRLADLLALLSAKCGGIRIRPIHPFDDVPAKRVLVRAVKTGKAPLELLPPLVLHDRTGGKHKPQTEAILRGEEELGWD